MAGWSPPSPNFPQLISPVSLRVFTSGSAWLSLTPCTHFATGTLDFNEFLSLLLVYRQTDGFSHKERQARLLGSVSMQFGSPIPSNFMRTLTVSYKCMYMSYIVCFMIHNVWFSIGSSDYQHYDRQKPQTGQGNPVFGHRP